MNGFTDRVFVSRPGKKLKRKENKTNNLSLENYTTCNVTFSNVCFVKFFIRIEKAADRIDLFRLFFVNVEMTITTYDIVDD